MKYYLYTSIKLFILILLTSKNTLYSMNEVFYKNAFVDKSLKKLTCFIHHKNTDDQNYEEWVNASLSKNFKKNKTWKIIENSLSNNKNDVVSALQVCMDLNNEITQEFTTIKKELRNNDWKKLKNVTLLSGSVTVQYYFQMYGLIATSVNSYITFKCAANITQLTYHDRLLEKHRNELVRIHNTINTLLNTFTYKIEQQKMN